MTYPTLTTVVQKTLRKLAQVGASGAQQYAEDMVVDAIQEAFNVLFDLEWWPQFRVLYTRSLDEATGLITQVIDENIRFEDIKFIRTQQRGRTPLPVMPDDTIPDLVTGTSALYYEPYNLVTGKPFRVVPFTAEDTLYLVTRVKPDDFVALDDEIPFDETAIVNGAAWQYFETDSSNPGAAQMCQIKFESRLEQLRKQIRSQPVIAGSNSQAYPTEWFTPP